MHRAYRLAFVFVAALAVRAAGIGFCQKPEPATTQQDRDLNEIRETVADHSHNIDSLTGRVDGMSDSVNAAAKASEAAGRHADLVIKLIGAIVALVALVGFFGYRDLRSILSRVRAVEDEARRHLVKVEECEKRVDTALGRALVGADTVEREAQRTKLAGDTAERIVRKLQAPPGLSPEASKELDAFAAAAKASAEMADRYLKQIEQLRRDAEASARELQSIQITSEMSPETKQKLEDISRKLELVEALGLPLDAESCFARGNALYSKGEYQRALDCYERAIELKPDDAEAFYNMACSFSLLNKKKEALSYLGKAIEKDSKLKEKAKSDDEFKNLWEDEDFKKIVQ